MFHLEFHVFGFTTRFVYSTCYAFFFAFYSVDKKLYLFKEYAKFSGKSSKAKGGSRQTVNNDSSGTRPMRGRQKDAQEKDDNKSNKDDIQKRKIVEAEAREEGEISESEAETKYRLDKEEKWLEWCSEVLDEEQETLKRLDRLQNTSVNLPKEKVFAFSVVSIFLKLLFHQNLTFNLLCLGSFENSQVPPDNWGQNWGGCPATQRVL